VVDLNDLSVSPAQGVATAKQIFDREGVLVVKNLLPAHVVRTVDDFLRAALQEIDSALSRYGFSLHDADAGERLTTLMQESPASLTEHERHMFLGHFPLSVRLGEPLRAIPQFLNTHPLLFELLSTSRLYAHMPPTARYVVPRCSLARVPLHQDSSYNRHMSDFCVVWTPLVPIDLACGGMVAYAQTHNAPEILAPAGHAAADGWLPPIDPSVAGGDGPNRVVLAPLLPGDVVIMGKRTMHESMPNLSDRLRISCDFRLFGEQARSTKHYLDLATNAVVAPQTAA
jgi:hypothetical protein